MLGLPLAFAAPAVLAALAGLPLLYYLLRVTPPRPQEIPFPPLKLVLDLIPERQTPNRTPWPILLLRLLIAACVILAMAGPVLNPAPIAAGAGPLVVVVDDGWPAAPDWERRVEAAAQRLEAAARAGRPAAVAVPSDGGRAIATSEAGAARDRLRALKPLPYTPDRLALAGALKTFVAERPDASIVWIADGVERGSASAFAAGLAALGRPLEIVTGSAPARAIAGAQNLAAGLEARVLRSALGGPGQGVARALDARGAALGEAPFDFAGKTETRATFDLPAELRNEISRIEIEGARSAGAVALLYERGSRRSGGLVSGEGADRSQPLLAANYYLRKALAPFADLREPRPGTVDPVESLLRDGVSILILADVGSLSGQAHDALRRFVEAGGVLLRFAGTRLAAGTDDLIPVRLRRGGRVLGGSMSWDAPKHLAPFDRSSPFFGLAAPDEVTVSRQVLAEPDPGLPGKTWAQLSDGTPLVTASRMGEGMIVLFHVTADTAWSNLPLSGLFVDMLRRIVDLSGNGAKGAGDETQRAAGGEQKGAAGDEMKSAAGEEPKSLAPLRTLDGFGVLGAPPASARPVPAGFEGPPDADHPPGFYGLASAPSAVNAMTQGETLAAANLAGAGVTPGVLRAAEPVDLQPFLLAAAFLLFCLDWLASLSLSGGARLRRAGKAGALAASLVAAMALAALFAPRSAFCEPAPAARRAGTVQGTPPVAARDVESALSTRLAYVVTGDAKADEASRQGLTSLSHALARRTSLTPGEPAAVDPARDELSFYPLLYWPIVAGRPQPPQETAARISAFMKQGGTVIFDTRDALTARPDGAPSPETLWLRQLLAGVDVPELAPVPADHVATKTFYLIDGFIGRYAGGVTWIEALPPAPADGSARPARSGDGVSPIVITSNDLAAGWASDGRGESLYALTPGGARQHELALRGGVNLVMYALTGNYKADQVHVRDLLERLAH
ncbi:DUF4159 domain-containing protein [Methylocella sp.]|uniref:DUF4159 domain-containing protein n=1 Tax=Methylocella sp. TaxID=1978226 RepID=UPI00378451D1